MKRFLPLFLLSLAACSPSSRVATQPSTSRDQLSLPTPQPSTASAAPTASPTIAVSPATVATPKPKSEGFYSGTAYLKGLGIDNNGSYESHINFEGSATLDADDKLYLHLSTECGESAKPYQTSKITIQLSPKTKTWKQLSNEYEDCDGYKGVLHENDDEQHQSYTTEDLGTTVKFNLGTNDPEETYHFRDLYGATINKQSEDRD